MIRADANRANSVRGDQGLPTEAAGRAVDEYLDVLNDAAFGAATPVTPKFISNSNPAARWTGAGGGLAFFAYCTNYLIDLEHAVIVDVEATTAVRQAEVTAQRVMLNRTGTASDSGRNGLVPTQATVTRTTWPSWCMSAASSRTFRCSTRLAEATAPFPDPTSPITIPGTATSALPGKNCLSSGGNTPHPGLASTAMASCATGQSSATATFAPSSRNAVPASQSARSLARSTREPAIWRGAVTHRRLRHLDPRAEKGGDVVCPPQAHPEARSPPSQRTQWSRRRVPPRRKRPKPPQARQADPDAGAIGAKLSEGKAEALMRCVKPPFNDRLFQRNWPDLGHLD